MTTGAIRVRQWREQRTARGQCHRCPRQANGYLCWRCRIQTAPKAVAQSRRQRITTHFLRDWALLSQGTCIFCAERPHLPRKSHCRQCAPEKAKFAYVYVKPRPSLVWPDATPRRALETHR